jgi:O-Antigen ligase
MELGVALVAGVLLLAATFSGDAFATAAGALVAAAVLGALALLGFVPLARGGAALVGALLALAAWSGVSVAWSIAPDLSWDELNRGLVYAAFAVVGVVLGSQGRRAARVAAAVLVVVLGATILWALAGKAIPSLFPDGGRAARLRDPIGYWNALALLADALLVLGLWLAATPGLRRAFRLAGAVLSFCAVVAVLLAASRAGVAGAVVAVLVWLWLGRERVERALLALAVSVPGILVAGWAFTRPGLVDDGQEHATRVADGRWFALALLLGAAAVAAGTEAVLRLELRGSSRRLLGRSLAAGLVALLLVGALTVAIAGDPLSSGRSVRQGPGRLAEAGLNNRREFWLEALRVAQQEPLTGTGAGTFEIARRTVRDDATSAVEPHSMPLQFLAGTGPLGVLLFAAVVAAAAAAAVGALRRLEGEEWRAAATLATVPVVYLLHALVDYDWDFIAVTAPALVAAGALATAGRSRVVPPPRPLAAAGLAAFAVAALVSVSLPWLAERELDGVTRKLEAGDFDAAVASAKRARSLNPLSIEPLQALGGVHASRRHVRQAREAFAEAVRLQPENADTWYYLGLYELDRRLYCQAYLHLNQAYTLDPTSTRWVPGGPLDEARDFVNEAGC